MGRREVERALQAEGAMQVKVVPGGQQEVWGIHPGVLRWGPGLPALPEPGRFPQGVCVAVSQCVAVQPQACVRTSACVCLQSSTSVGTLPLRCPCSPDMCCALGSACAFVT